IPLMFVLDIKVFSIFILVNLFCRVVALSYNIRSIESLIFDNSYKIYDIFRKEIFSEIAENFISGFPIMMGAIFSMFMTTIPRIIIERNFSITEYGLFSFAYSTLNVAIQMVSALSSVFYPSLKKVKSDNYEQLYFKVSEIINLLSVFSLLLYYGTF